MICLDQGQIRETSYFSACSASRFISHLLELMLIQDKLIQADVFFLLLETHVVFPFQGEMTGVCVNTTKTCEVLAWCPVEDDSVIPEYVKTLNYSYCKLTPTCNVCDNV